MVGHGLQLVLLYLVVPVKLLEILRFNLGALQILRALARSEAVLIDELRRVHLAWVVDQLRQQVRRQSAGQPPGLYLNLFAGSPLKHVHQFLPAVVLRALGHLFSPLFLLICQRLQRQFAQVIHMHRGGSLRSRFKLKGPALGNPHK